MYRFVGGSVIYDKSTPKAHIEALCLSGSPTLEEK